MWTKQICKKRENRCVLWMKRKLNRHKMKVKRCSDKHSISIEFVDRFCNMQLFCWMAWKINKHSSMVYTFARYLCEWRIRLSGYKTETHTNDDFLISYFNVFLPLFLSDLSFCLFAFHWLHIYLFFFPLFFNFQMKSPIDCEANGINHSNDNLISNAQITSIQCDERVAAAAAGHAGQMNHHSNANGSLITMTMKNNHLIVETEERSVSIRHRLTYKHAQTHTHTHLQLEHLSNARDPFIFIVVFQTISFRSTEYCVWEEERTRTKSIHIICKTFCTLPILIRICFFAQHIFLPVFEFYARLRYFTIVGVRYSTKEKPITIISSLFLSRENSIHSSSLLSSESKRQRGE